MTQAVVDAMSAARPKEQQFQATPEAVRKWLRPSGRRNDWTSSLQEIFRIKLPERVTATLGDLTAARTYFAHGNSVDPGLISETRAACWCYASTILSGAIMSRLADVGSAIPFGPLLHLS